MNDSAMNKYVLQIPVLFLNLGCAYIAEANSSLEHTMAIGMT